MGYDGHGFSTLLVRCKPLPKESDMSDCLDATSWAVTEFADADLGDLRRTQRLVQRAHAPRPAARCRTAGSWWQRRNAQSRLSLFHE